MTKDFALVFHMNLDHANLTRQQSLDLIERDLEVMLGSVAVPLNISSTARDWELIEAVNPALLDSIRSNPFLKILPGPYSHAILGHFPDSIKAQLELGHETHTRIFGNALSPYGFVPEFAFDSSLLPQLSQYWPGNIASRPASHFMPILGNEAHQLQGNGLEDSVDGVVKVLAANGEEVAINITLRGEVNRKIHKFMRGLNDPVHVTDPIKVVLESASSPVTILVQDFETPLINKAVYDGTKITRIDRWQSLMDHLPQSGINFVALDINVLNAVQRYAAQQEHCYVMLPRDKDKWIKSTHSYELLLRLNRLAAKADPTSRYDTKSLLQAMTSDAFVVVGDNGYEPKPMRARMLSPVTGRQIFVDSFFNEYDPKRYLESTHIIYCLENGLPLTQGTSRFPKEMQTYFALLDKMMSR